MIITDISHSTGLINDCGLILKTFLGDQNSWRSFSLRSIQHSVLSIFSFL